MSDPTRSNALETWNPRVSPGCDNIVTHPDVLKEPFGWRAPRTVFVNSMSDLFHPKIPDEFIARVFAVMAATPEHTYQVLTKRPRRMRALLSRGELGTEGFPDMVEEAMPEFTHAGIERGNWPLRNVWLGASVEDQQRANERVPALLDTPAAVRFLSCEPLLGRVDLTRWLPREYERQQGGYWRYGRGCDVSGNGKKWMAGQSLGWVIVGGGPDARPMHPDWARQLRDDCSTAGVPFHFKQTGTVLARELGIGGKGDKFDRLPAEFQIRQYPKAPPEDVVS